MKRLLIRIAATCAVIVLAVAATIVTIGLRDDAAASDLAVVLGTKVRPDGRPSRRLQSRLDKAAELYASRLVPRILVSGGTGREGFDEARVMAEYLATKKNIPRDAILLDEHGDTTRATARNTAALMQAQGFTSVIVVTQYFHVARCRLAFGQAGIGTVTAVHASHVAWRDLFSIAREVVALPVYWIAEGNPAKR